MGQGQRDQPEDPRNRFNEGTWSEAKGKAADGSAQEV